MDIRVYDALYGFYSNRINKDEELQKDLEKIENLLVVTNSKIKEQNELLLQLENLKVIIARFEHHRRYDSVNLLINYYDKISSLDTLEKEDTLLLIQELEILLGNTEEEK